MARTKRLDTAAVLDCGTSSVVKSRASVQNIYRTAAYVRLSVEDSGKPGGESLENQEAVLRSYIASQEELLLYKVYTDNGYTGTKFERPAFDRMMADMRAGVVNCIVVKDLSRLGRNYLEAGKYIEQVFPFFRTRFISVADGYDSLHGSATEEGLLLPLKNLINEGYARDISTKVSTALAARKRQGKFMGKYAPYGYRKDPADKNHLVIDPETAGIVERIFQMRLDDLPLGTIARTLNAEGISCPARYRLETGLSCEHKYQNAIWDNTNVRRLLQNQVYVGDMVYGKEQSSFAQGIKRHAIPRAEWKVTENTHDAIISREVFAAVQDKLEASRQKFERMIGKNQDFQPENLFRGLLRCGECGSAMKLSKFVCDTGANTLYYALYECCRRKKGRDCTMKSIRKEELDTAVLEAIRYHIRLFLDTRRLVRKQNRDCKTVVSSLRAQEQTLQNRLQKVERLRCSAYEDYHEGLLEENEYLEVRKQYAAEVDKRKAELEALHCRLEDYSDDIGNGGLAKTAARYPEITELNRELIEAFISEIFIFPDSRVKIRFRFQDEFDRLMRLAGQRREEMACVSNM